MPKNWKTIKLGELCDITMGQSPESSFYNSNKEGMPFLQGNRTFGDKYPIFDTWTSFVTKEANAGDVIMSVRAPVGDVNITQRDMCLGRGVCGLRHKENAQEFLYYLMCYSKESLLNRENGTVFGSVNRTDITNLEVTVPSLEVQRMIGDTLSALDARIAENKKINHHFLPDEKKEGGEYVMVAEVVKKIDKYERLVVMQNGTKIPIDDVLEVEGDIFRVMENNE